MLKVACRDRNGSIFSHENRLERDFFLRAGCAVFLFDWLAHDWCHSAPLWRARARIPGRRSGTHFSQCCTFGLLNLIIFHPVPPLATCKTSCRKFSIKKKLDQLFFWCRTWFSSVNFALARPLAICKWQVNITDCAKLCPRPWN